MTQQRDEDAWLESHFRAERDNPAEPGADLLARVMADATAAQAGFARAGAGRPAPRRRALADIVRALGGWPAAAGLSAATLAGLWIGIAAPDGLASVAVAVMGGGEAAYVIDLDPAAGFGFGEEAS